MHHTFSFMLDLNWIKHFLNLKCFFLKVVSKVKLIHSIDIILRLYWYCFSLFWSSHSLENDRCLPFSIIWFTKDCFRNKYGSLNIVMQSKKLKYLWKFNLRKIMILDFSILRKFVSTIYQLWLKIICR